ASGDCTSGGLEGATISILAPGKCAITASQAGSDIYNAAPDVVRTFSVIDAVAPTASPAQSPTATAGWNNTNVTVAWNWTDTGAGIDPANCTTSSTSSSEGNSVVLGATCKDLAGNTGTASYSLMVDKTAPTVIAAASSAPNANGWYNGNVTVLFTCADTLSAV